MKWILTILFLLPLILIAQTRIYFNRNVTAPISPTINAAWTVTSGNLYYMCFPNGKTQFTNRSTNLTVTTGASGTTPPQKMIGLTFISQPLAAQTISTGTVISFQMRASRSSSIGMALILYVRVCDADGTNITEIGNASSTALVTATATNRTISITTGSDVVVTDNKRLIFEIGGNFTSGASSTTVNILTQLIPELGDLPVDNTTTSLLNPWVEFSQTLLFIKVGGIFN